MSENIKEARLGLEDAREALSKANARLDAWLAKNGEQKGFSDNLDFLKLEALVNKCGAREERAQEFVKYLKTGSVSDVAVVTKAIERVLDDAEIDTTSSMKSNSSRPGQRAFVTRLTERDRQCPILLTPASRCVGSHIISYDYWTRNKVFIF